MTTETKLGHFLMAAFILICASCYCWGRGWPLAQLAFLLSASFTLLVHSRLMKKRVEEVQERFREQMRLIDAASERMRDIAMNPNIEPMEKIDRMTTMAEEFGIGITTVSAQVKKPDEEPSP